ncbi:MAG: tRNA (adenosine(37)-N6)-threonylcarbamoyltransferase complex ATPase subunit type 1 TsaE [Burkholderiales bacterium]|nr:tRNA (adenosine(37)-N6)-threonylcarbamoyltransferase complex ATPase subunit type 1 TsaE [Burkholderiales bacterium]
MHAPNHTLSAYLPDEAATLAAGEMLATALRPGLTVYLLGDLGAGKTTLTRGLLRGLGYAGKVKSPTYTLVEPYVISNLYLHHFDLYRFADPLEWEDAGFRDMFNPESVCVVEWPDKAAGLLPEPDWTIELQPRDEGRCLTLTAGSANGIRCLTHLTAFDTTPPAA